MITPDFRRWNVAHLVGASVSYWLGLAAATLTSFARAVISVAGLGGERGAASAMHASPRSSALHDPPRGGFAERAAGMRSPLPAERRQQQS